MSNATNKRIRSPSYPTMALPEALVAIGKLEHQYRLSAIDRVAAAKLLGYGSLSGPAAMALSSLASYGFVERAGKGEMRVTERGRSVLHPNTQDERTQALRAAALEPQLYQQLRERFADVPVPPEEGVISYLHRKGFNPTAVKPAARSFLQTMSFIEEMTASQDRSGPARELSQSEGRDSKGAQSIYGGAGVGDLIQWESDGILQLEKPLRVRFVSDDGNWVAVEGSETGIPMPQVIVEERASGGPRKAAVPRFPIIANSDQAPPVTVGTDLRFKLAKGIVVQIQSRDELGEAELTTLVTLLSAQRDALKS